MLRFFPLGIFISMLLANTLVQSWWLSGAYTAWAIVIILYLHFKRDDIQGIRTLIITIENKNREPLPSSKGVFHLTRFLTGSYQVIHKAEPLVEVIEFKFGLTRQQLLVYYRDSQLSGINNTTHCNISLNPSQRAVLESFLSEVRNG